MGTLAVDMCLIVRWFVMFAGAQASTEEEIAKANDEVMVLLGDKKHLLRSINQLLYCEDLFYGSNS